MSLKALKCICPIPFGSVSKELACNVGDPQVRFLDQEDPLEKGMATHFSILAWRIPWTEEPGGLQSKGCKESDMTERLTLSLFMPSSGTAGSY